MQRAKVESPNEQTSESGNKTRRLLELNQATIACMGQGMYAVDTQGLVTFINPEAERLFGWDAEELLGRRMHDLTHYKHLDGSAFPIEECAGFEVLHKGRVLKDFEDHFIRKDGRFFPVSYSSSPLRGHDGDIAGLVVVFQDITERKRAEEVRARLAAIVESSDDAIVSKDLNGIIRTWNVGAERLFGYTEEEAIGQPATMLMPPDRVSEEPGILERIRRGERIDHYETVRRRKDGTLLNISLTVSPIINQAGQIVGASKIARDISQRKLAETALRESEARYRTLFELAPVAVYSIDTSGVIRNFNGRAAELWGRTPVPGDTDERFCGSYKLYRPDGSFMPHEQCPMAEVVSGTITGAHDEEVIIERSDGSRVTVIVNILPLKNESGEITGAISCFYDITERKCAEEERGRLLAREQAARQEAEVANRIKDQFVAVVSHELRNPLGTILMWTAMLKSGSHREELPRAMEVIERNARLQLRLVEDLLDLNRVSRGQITLEVGAHDLAAAILLPSLESTRFNAEAKHIVVEFERSTEAVLIEGDAVRLQQIFTNVLSNAVKFTPENGSIRVTLTGEIESAVVKIRDTGEGITPEFLPHVFEIFRQQERGVGTSRSGLGIGLALVKSLVNLHGGTIEIASEGPGRGTEVTVRLPRRTSTDADTSRKPAASSGVASALQGLSILIVEDCEDIREITEVMLDELGARVSCAADGREALDAMATVDPDLVLCDLGMPVMDGFEFIEELQRIRGSMHPPVIAVSASTSPADHERTRLAGFAGHIDKPLTGVSLLSAVTQAQHPAYPLPKEDWRYDDRTTYSDRG